MRIISLVILIADVNLLPLAETNHFITFYCSNNSLLAHYFYYNREFRYFEFPTCLIGGATLKYLRSTITLWELLAERFNRIQDFFHCCFYWTLFVFLTKLSISWHTLAFDILTGTSKEVGWYKSSSDATVRVSKLKINVLLQSRPVIKYLVGQRPTYLKRQPYLFFELVSG